MEMLIWQIVTTMWAKIKLFFIIIIIIICCQVACELKNIKQNISKIFLLKT